MIETVRDALKNDAKTRNSDLWLILNIMKKLGLKMEIDLNRFKEYPTIESITRARRDVQNKEKLYPPTIKSVAMKRRIKQEEFREYYGN